MQISLAEVARDILNDMQKFLILQWVSLRIAIKILNPVEVILGETFRLRVNHSINVITASGNILVTC